MYKCKPNSKSMFNWNLVLLFRHHKSKKSKRDRGRDRDDKGEKSKFGKKEDPEIAEANALRAKLGLAPLKL